VMLTRCAGGSGRRRTDCPRRGGALAAKKGIDPFDPRNAFAQVALQTVCAMSSCVCVCVHVRARPR